MSFQLQQIANYLFAGQLRGLDYTNNIRFKFEPVSARWELSDYTMPNGKEYLLAVATRDDGFDFVAEDNNEVILYREPLEKLSRLTQIIDDWPHSLDEKYLTQEGKRYTYYVIDPFQD